MLDLRGAAKLARDRINERLEEASSHKKGLSRSVAIVQRGGSFRYHLTEALKRGGVERTSPSSAPVSLFLAFPEKLLAKWYYLAFGPQRIARSDAPSIVTDPEWKAWSDLGEGTALINFARTDPKFVLVAHGLSAIEDSSLLLAELGRAFRAARVLGVTLQVLLAGTNWISFNRSLKKFDLSEAQIQAGLLVCQEARRRLYEALGAEVTVHEIVEFAKKGAINKNKIQMIASRYVELASIVWGKDIIDTADPLSNEILKRIGRPLQLSIDAQSPLAALNQFPGALQAMEKALAPHLSIVRTLAQRFRVLSLDTFSYYFAQYYAQDSYRGTHLKVAPLSERAFDEPFDALDESFRSWGEGHEPEVKASSPRRRKQLAAVYLPQYRIGDWELLPYTPLSLQAVAHSDRTISELRIRIILLLDNTLEQEPKVRGLLQHTLEKNGSAHLNRLTYDVLSFIQAAVIARGRNIVDDVCRAVGLQFDEILARFDKELPHHFAAECEDSANLGDMWLSWLDHIETDSVLNYVPCHVLLATLTKTDWTQERLGASAALLIIANGLAAKLSG